MIAEMSSRGQTFGLAMLYALFFFIFGILFINFLHGDITTAQNNMQCSSPALISDGTKVACLLIDGVMPYFIIGILSLAIGTITARLAI